MPYLLLDLERSSSGRVTRVGERRIYQATDPRGGTPALTQLLGSRSSICVYTLRRRTTTFWCDNAYGEGLVFRRSATPSMAPSQEPWRQRTVAQPGIYAGGCSCFPPLPLEVGPQIQLGGLGERCKLP